MSTPETTPRLSDLIREGLADPLIVEDHDAYFVLVEDDEHGEYCRACALGMTYWAVQRRRGLSADEADTEIIIIPFFERLQALIPDLLRLERYHCPVCGGWMRVGHIIDHLHSTHRWAAQRIASWLDETVYADSTAVQR